MRFVFVMTLSIAAVSTVHAQPTSAYYGLSYGQFNYAEADGTGTEIVSGDTDSYRLVVGYQFTENLSFEGGWGQTSTLRDSTFLDIGFPFGVVPLNFEYETDILTVRFLGVLPFDNGITLLGGLGYAEMDQEINVEYVGVVQGSADIEEGQMTYYAGVQYEWERVALRLAYEKYDPPTGVDIDETSLSFFYKL
jgi:predicted porin